MENKNKKPEIRFKGFTDEWEEKLLGDLGSVSMNKRIFKDQTADEGDIPFYKIGTFGKNPNAFISRELFEEYKSKYPYPEKGDLLLSASGSIGKIVEYLGKDEYFQDSNIVWLKHDNHLINSFLKQFYSIVKWSGLEGSTIKRLYNKDILDTPISLPTPEEQTQLGTYFKNLDHLITLRQQKYDKLVTIKKAMLEKMFPKNGADVPEIRFKGFVGAWEERELGNIAVVKTGYPFDSNDFDDNGEYLVITNGNIQNDFHSVDSSRGNRIDIKTNTTLNEYVLNPNDILVTMDGTVGRTAKVEEQKQILAQRVGRLTAKSEAEFLYQFLNTGKFFEEMTLISHGGTIKHISLTEISNYRSYMPTSIEEQRKIGTFLSHLDNLLFLHQTELKKLKNIKKACVEKMFV